MRDFFVGEPGGHREFVGAGAPPPPEPTPLPVLYAMLHCVCVNAGLCHSFGFNVVSLAKHWTWASSWSTEIQNK